MINTMLERYNAISSALFGILTAALIVYSSQYVYYKYRPVEDIYVASLQVPNYKEGRDPEVLYSNEKREEFQGEFIVEVKNFNDIAVCRGVGGPFTYSVGEKTSVTTLNDYIWIDPLSGELSECADNLQPGIYYVETTFFINQEGRPERIYGPIHSNLFEVLPNEQPSVL